MRRDNLAGPEPAPGSNNDYVTADTHENAGLVEEQVQTGTDRNANDGGPLGHLVNDWSNNVSPRSREKSSKLVRSFDLMANENGLGGDGPGGVQQPAAKKPRV
jgi:hypothetical protein